MSGMNKQTILIVDDLRTNALALAKILKPEWLVQTAFDGPSALERASEEPAPSIILLDIKMPGMDGHEVCRQLKQSEKTRDIPVVFVTALDDQKEEAYGLGDVSPLEYAKTEVGAREVENLLGRIEHGVFS